MLDCPSQSSMRLQQAATTTKPVQALMHCSALTRTTSPETSACHEITASHRDSPFRESSIYHMRLSAPAGATLSPRHTPAEAAAPLLGCGSALTINSPLQSIRRPGVSLRSLLLRMWDCGIVGKSWLHSNIPRRDHAAQYAPISLKAVLTTGFTVLITW